jgi:hypothetical protein
MKRITYIGVDDTDTLGSPGTGRVVRGLARHLEALGLGESLGVSRHQLLVDERIRYTSHNSSKCIAFGIQGVVADFYQPCLAYMRGCIQMGADPGLCVADAENVNQAILDFGQRAVCEILSKDEALKVAERNSIFLQEVGGDGSGVIGALAAVGLRASGNDGRLVDLKGIRDIGGIITVKELLERTAIDLVQDETGKTLAHFELVDTLDRVRPSLVGGKAVLRVELVAVESGKRMWQPVEARHKHNKDKEGHEHG